MTTQTQPNIMDTTLSPGLNPFMPQGFIPPSPPVMQPRSFPTQAGGNPAMLAGIQRFLQGLQTQQQNQALPPVPAATPATPAAPVAGLAGSPIHPSGAFLRWLQNAAHAKFNMGMATPLADRMGWSAGWGTRPSPMGMAPAVPAAPAPQPAGFAVGEPMGMGGGGGGGDSFRMPSTPNIMPTGFGMGGGFAGQPPIGLPPGPGKLPPLGGGGY